MIIYKVTNKINGNIYIGQTIRSLDDRIISHVKSSKHPKVAFHYAIVKYGFDNFKWDILEQCNSIQELNKREQYYIRKYNTFKDGYNMNEGGSNATHSTITKSKISNSLRGNPKSAEHIKHMKDALTGRKLSEDHKKNISLGLIGNSFALGYKHSDETKQKVSDANKMRKYKPHSDETKQKIRDSVNRKIQEKNDKEI